MLMRNVGRLRFIAATIGLALVIGVWIDHRDRDDKLAPSSSADAPRLPSPAPGRRDAPTPTASDAIGSGRLSHDVTRATADETRVRLEVRTPSDVHVGEVFEVRIDIDANAALRELTFLIGYEKTCLALVSWSTGEFTQQGGLAANFGAEEPSDGNIQAVFTLGNGRSATGIGSIAVFQFEAIKAGKSAITLQNTRAVDPGGGIDPKVIALRDAQVTIR